VGLYTLNSVRPIACKRLGFNTCACQLKRNLLSNATCTATTWTYGDLSNEELWLWYGFVPEPALHGGTAVTFQLPEGALRAGLGSVAGLYKCVCGTQKLSAIQNRDN
jgi:hypothetical protein